MSSRWRYSTSCWFLLPALSLVVFESWHLNTLHHLSEVLPGALVVPACGGHWCYCVLGITAWGTRIGGPSAISGVSCVPGSATVARGWRGWRSQGKGSLCYVWGCWVCGSHCCRQNWGVKVPPRRGTRSLGPTPTAAWFPVVTGITVAQRLKRRVLPPLMLPRSLGQWAEPLQPRVWDWSIPGSSVPWFYLLCVHVHLPFQVQMCGILQRPVVFSRDTFVGPCMFHWLQIEGERQRECFILPWY